MITTSEVAVSLTIDSASHLEQITKELEVFGTVTAEKDQTIVSVVGYNINETEEIIKKLFGSVKDVPIRMVSYGGSPHNISLLVSADEKVHLLKQLNKGMFGLD